MPTLGHTAGMAADWASRYLPSSLGRRRSAGQPSQPPPELCPVTVQLASGEQVLLEAAADGSLEQLQRECQQAAGVLAGMQGLEVQEQAQQSGLSSLAHSVGNRRHLNRQLADWSSFLLLPEGLRRELRWRGLAGWLRQHVWEPLQQPRLAPPGTVWVVVATLDGGRRHILLRGTTTLRQLRREVVQQAGVPPGSQRLVVVQRSEPSAAVRLLRALLPVLLAAGAWLAAAARWVLGLPPCSELLVRLQTESGKEVELSVSPDMSLREIQRQVWERHGEQVSLQHVSLSPAGKAASNAAARSSSGGAGGAGGAGGSSSGLCAGSSPVKRRLGLG